MMGIVWLDEMQLQLLWLLQPASLLQLLQRPVWLDAWVHGEEERASLLWRGLPNDVILHILKLRAAKKRIERTAKITARMCRFGFPYVSSSRVEFAQSRGQIHEHLMACRFDGAHCIQVREASYLWGYVCGRVA